MEGMPVDPYPSPSIEPSPSYSEGPTMEGMPVDPYPSPSIEPSPSYSDGPTMEAMPMYPYPSPSIDSSSPSMEPPTDEIPPADTPLDPSPPVMPPSAGSSPSMSPSMESPTDNVPAGVPVEGPVDIGTPTVDTIPPSLTPTMDPPSEIDLTSTPTAEFPPIIMISPAPTTGPNPNIIVPSFNPTAAPTVAPTTAPTAAPTAIPTIPPTDMLSDFKSIVLSEEQIASSVCIGTFTYPGSKDIVCTNGNFISLVPLSFSQSDVNNSTNSSTSDSSVHLDGTLAIEGDFHLFDHNVTMSIQSQIVISGYANFNSSLTVNLKSLNDSNINDQTEIILLRFDSLGNEFSDVQVEEQKSSEFCAKPKYTKNTLSIIFTTCILPNQNSAGELSSSSGINIGGIIGGVLCAFVIVAAVTIFVVDHFKEKKLQKMFSQTMKAKKSNNEVEMKRKFTS
eukprot:TRINITY_DN1152_c1_g2_i1.p1 TRINITY_DN1152_c1_g2~~TRINITY_DN1152_c1_g2_i1.p1  ORF type:complete len:448 (-),score=74.96 TRINITY_DN1152_c1_g2_i1:140-1483(-)